MAELPQQRRATSAGSRRLGALIVIAIAVLCWCLVIAVEVSPLVRNLGMIILIENRFMLSLLIRLLSLYPYLES